MNINKTGTEHCGSRRIWRYGVAIGVIAASAMTARAFDTSWVAPNQPISAAHLKGNLDEISARLTVLESTTLGYPAVDSDIFGDGEWCGPAPTSFSVSTDTTGGPFASPASFGRILTTSEGSFGQNFTTAALPFNCGSGPNYCWGPITFFLINPNAAKTIMLNGYFDNGPSFVYIDGNIGPNKFLSSALVLTTTSANVTIPTGPFALSLIGCSNDGPSLGLEIQNKFITNNGLQVDYDRTFHRLGK